MKFLFKTLILLFATVGFSQNDLILDSLYEQLNILKEDTSRVEILNELAFQFRRKDPSKAKSYAEEAKLISQKNQFKKGTATAFLRLGLIAKTEGNLELAEEFYLKSLTIRKELNDKKGIAGAYINLGNLVKLSGDFVKAGNYYNEASKELSSESSPSLKSKIHNNAGGAFQQIGNYEKAVFHYEKALELKTVLNDDLGRATALSNLGSLYTELDNFEKAKEYLTESLIIFRKNEEPFFEAITLIYVGNLHYKEGKLSNALSNYEDAEKLKSELDDTYLAFLYKNKGNTLKALGLYQSTLENYYKSLNLFQSLGNLNETAALNNNIGEIFLAKKEYEAAVPVLKNSLSALDSLENPVLKSIVLFNLSEAYLNTKNYDLAFDLNKKYNTLKDSLNQNYKEAMTYKVNLEEERTKNVRLEQERQEKVAELERKSLINKGLIAFGILWILLTVVTIFNYLNRQKRRLAEKNEEIARQNEQLAWQEIDDLLQKRELDTTYARLEGQELERQRIAQDLHDRLGSMLATVKLYFAGFEEKMENLKKENLEQQQKASQLLDDACQEVRRIAHDMKSGTLARFGLEAELRAVANTIESSNQMKVQVLVYGLKERLNNKIETGIYRIIQELISNILKHSEASKMSIQLNRIGDDLNVTVEDNGKGFQPDLAQKNGGMGLSGIQSRVHELNGTLNIDSGKGRGTTVIIDVPCEVN